LLDGGIFYVQTRERQFDETEDYFTFQVTDGYTTSTTYRLNITIQVFNIMLICKYFCDHHFFVKNLYFASFCTNNEIVDPDIWVIISL